MPRAERGRWLWRIRRKDFHLPLAQILDQPVQLQPDFDVFCRGLVIVVEQVENQSPTVGFPSQLAQHVTTRLQTEARPSCRVIGAHGNARLRLSGPDDEGPPAVSYSTGPLLGAELGQVIRHQHLEPGHGTPLSRWASTLVSKKTLCLSYSSARGLSGFAEIKAIRAAGTVWRRRLDILSNPHLRLEHGFWNAGFFRFREHSS
jgi:hypothetical protein